MGRPKANLPVAAIDVANPGVPVDRDTFLIRIVRTLLTAGLDDVVVVLGHEMDAIAGEFGRSGLPARLVENPDYASGQLSSLVAGLRVIDRPGVSAALVTLVDVPFVSAATVRAVVRRYLDTRAPIVRPARAGRYGHPLIVDRSLFGLLRQADPAAGAKPIVRAHATAEGEVQVDDAGAFSDIDTQQEYEQALRIFGAGGPAPTPGVRPVEDGIRDRRRR
jgi:molybdenum cofactor cytidylyltransferase